jgi:hypothetical protein
MIKILSIFLLIGYIGCKGSDTVHVTINNKSNVIIDSVVIPSHLSYHFAIGSGTSKTLPVNLDRKDLSSKGAFAIYIYQKGKRTITEFGFHDFGKVDRLAENIFVFDHGLSGTNKAPEMPAVFKLYIFSKDSTVVDSIRFAESLESRIIVYPNYRECIIDFEKFSEQPVVRLLQQGKWKSLQIENDWDNWNRNSLFIYIGKDGTLSYSEK